jgi:membrane-bound lytic murein transglycosylase D
MMNVKKVGVQKLFKSKISMKLKIIFLICLFFVSCSKQEANSQSQFNIDFSNYITSLHLPDKLEWCGEEVPLEIPEVRERAEREFYILLQQPGQVVLYLKRANRWFPMFERITREHNMPEDIKYLAVAESALYQSRSSKGALGFWQLMSGTAKELGLRVDEYVDERRSPEKSTYAAMKYLKQTFEATESWMYTAAGYNMGYYGIQKSIKYQDQADDYFDLFLNEETSRFIFRIAIIKEIMENAEDYGFNLDEKDLYQPYNTIKIKWNSSISDLAEWAKKHDTNYKDVRLLNPWILKRELNNPGPVPYEILIPKTD